MSVALRHDTEHRGEGFRVSTENGSTAKKPRLNNLSDNVHRLVPVHNCVVLHGVDYIRAASDIMRLVFPSASGHFRYSQTAALTGIPDSVLERIEYRQTYQPQSIKTEYIVTLLRFATANGFDVFKVRGIRQIHDHIFGVK